MTTTGMTLAELFELQHELQVESFGVDPLNVQGEERARFILWNAYALADELHELTGEVGWKPWATSRHVNEPAAMREGVDLLHFFMNIMMAVAPRGSTPDRVASSIAVGYRDKRNENARRQRDGYDGMTNKCPNCRRDRSESTLIEQEDVVAGAWADTVCPCGYVWHAASAR